MTASERALLENLLTDSPWYPWPGPQLQAYLSPADEVFYGGAAGGGKSDLILGLAVTAHRRTIIFRREYTQLQGLIDRSMEIIGARGSYNGQQHIWRLNDGRQIEFGAVQYEKDVARYQGRPHDLVCFDELPNFTEAQYRFLNGWKRTADPNQRVRTVATGNPPTTAEGQWVIRYWAPWLSETHPNPAKPGELRWFAVIDGEDVEVDGPEPIAHQGELIRPTSRTFIPARVEDNPAYMATGYDRQLMALPEPLRSQLRYGLFNVAVDDDPWQVIPTAWVKAAQERWRPERPTCVSPDGLEVPAPISCLGVDVARGGKDQTVLVARIGNWFAPLQVYPGQATPNGPLVAAQVLAAIGDERPPVNVDVIGVGASVYDSLVAQGINVIGVNFAEGTRAHDRSGRLGFANVRAEAYWRLREALEPDKGDSIALPPDPELLADLCAPRWELRTTGIQVEAKEDVKARIGRSPDKGDAVVLAALTRVLEGKLFY